MGNIIIGIKRFFQNKNTVTILGILASVGVIYFAYNYRIKKSTEPVNVPYATRMIAPRTLITKEMVSTKKVPGGVVTKNVLTNTNDIIGKYVLNTAVIPDNGLFYRSMLVDWDHLPTGVSYKLKENEYLAELPVNMDTTFGNSIFPGNYIDIYYKTRESDGARRIWVGRFIKGIQVLDVVDSSGNSVFETAGEPRIPAKLQFALPQKEYLLFEKWVRNRLSIDLYPVQRNSNYKSDGLQITGVEIQQEIEKQYVPDSMVIPGGNK